MSSRLVYEGNGVWATHDLPPVWTPDDDARAERLEAYDIWIDSLEPWINHIDRDEARQALQDDAWTRTARAQNAEHSVLWWSSAEGQARQEEIEQELRGATQ